MAKTKKQQPEPAQVFEVTVRRPDGHETVHRIAATSEADARRIVDGWHAPVAGRGKVTRPTVVGVEKSGPTMARWE